MDKKRYIKNGKIAVIYSPCYGTSYLESGLNIFDPILAEKIDKDENYDLYIDELDKNLKEENKHLSPCLFKSDMNSLKIEWFEKGDIIEFSEYDGYDKVWSNRNIDYDIVA